MGSSSSLVFAEAHQNRSCWRPEPNSEVHQLLILWMKSWEWIKEIRKESTPMVSADEGENEQIFTSDLGVKARLPWGLTHTTMNMRMEIR